MTSLTNYRLTFRLKQHTPIIHFQHEQAGATLRATEVKPKLDRFLAEKLESIFPNNAEAKKVSLQMNLALKNNKRSLYKLAFEPMSEARYYVPVSHKLDQTGIKAINKRLSINASVLQKTTYFGNEEAVKDLPDDTTGLDKLRVALEVKGNNATVSGHIYCFDVKLLKYINKALPYFFAYENFGTRQNKGFGCFEVVEMNNKKLNDYPKDLLPAVYNNVYAKKLDDTFKWQEIINMDYSQLKAGIPGSKKISKLKKYFDNENIKWEKEWLKKKINGDVLVAENGEFKFIRVMLGLATQYDVQVDKDNKEPVNVEDGEMKDDENNDGQQQKKKDIIQRFKSPIVFKFYYDTIYLCANEISEKEKKIFNHKFNFKTESGNIYTLNTPDKFNVKKFLNWAFNNRQQPLKGYTKIK